MSSEAGQKIGSGHVAAMGRAGFKEFAQILQAFPGQGIQPAQEPGLVGNLTPQEVLATKGGDAYGYEAALSGRATATPQPPPPQRQEGMER